jgi:GGDEF domain-containing protein
MTQHLGTTAYNPQNKWYDKIGRSFSLVFNRASMYKMDHPHTAEAISQFYNTISEGLGEHSPIALFMNHDQFFIEDQPFDPRLNTSRLVKQFKQSAIESISFENGIEEREIADFFKVFCDNKKYPHVDEMKSILVRLGVVHVRLNYIFFKKMTSDDEVILKDNLNQIRKSLKNNPRQELVKEVLNRITEEVVLEEIEKSISLKSLLDNPAEISKELIKKDLAPHNRPEAGSGTPGAMIVRQLVQLKREVGDCDQNPEKINLSELAHAVLDMKAHLLAGLEAHKDLGIIYENENQIVDETNEISDRVVVQLVRQEYKKGAISIQRLGLILRRLISEPTELQRLLPKLKAAMLAEGMPASDFIELVKEIGKELQGDEILEVLKKSAEKIGVDREELVKKIKIDPDGAAELIYLASEIRNATGNKKVLTELLVDYIEKVGSKLADQLSEVNGDNSILQEIILDIGSKIVDKLKVKDIDNDVLVAVEKRLGEKIDKLLDRIENHLTTPEYNSSIEVDPKKTSIFKMLEESVEEGDELQKILTQVRQAIEAGDIDENDFHQIHEAILRIKTNKSKGKSKSPVLMGVLNHISTLLYIEKEISRSLRYDTPFSTITFSVFDLKPQKTVPAGVIRGNDISQSIMGELINILRGPDIVGILNKKTIIVLLPMTTEKNAKIAMNRIVRKLHDSPFVINDIPVVVQFAAAVTSCSPERTQDLQSYLSVAESNHNDMIYRLKYMQDLM